MADYDAVLNESFQCVRCGSPFEVTLTGDLMIATCPAGDLRYVLTYRGPGAEGDEKAEESLVGRTLGPCRLVARAGYEGGVPIYQGLDIALNQPRTVHVLAGPAAKDRAQLVAFVRTAKLATAARHAALANVTLLAPFAGGMFTITPALEGRTLEQAVKGQGRLRLREALRIARRLTEGLAALHKRGIVHRNIGPHTVSLLLDGEPLLRNFAGAFGPHMPAEPKEVVGQPGFLAPEQISGVELDGRADLYSLGALLYYAVVGRAPFAGATIPGTLRNQLAGPDAAREALTLWAPPELVSLLMSLLATDPAARPAHARVVVDKLGRLLRHIGQPVAGEPHEEAKAPPRARPPLVVVARPVERPIAPPPVVKAPPAPVTPPPVRTAPSAEPERAKDTAARSASDTGPAKGQRGRSSTRSRPSKASRRSLGPIVLLVAVVLLLTLFLLLGPVCR